MELSAKREFETAAVLLTALHDVTADAVSALQEGRHVAAADRLARGQLLLGQVTGEMERATGSFLDARFFHDGRQGTTDGR